MSRSSSSRWGRVPGNREVSRIVLPDLRTQVAAALEEEGGSWGEPGFPHGSEATRDEMLRALREAEERQQAPERVGAAQA